MQEQGVLTLGGTEPLNGAQAVGTTAPRIMVPRATDYADLKRLIKERNLLDKQPLYYTIRIVVNLAIYALAVSLLFVVQNFALQLLLLAPLFAFAYAQVAFVAHNSGHRQICPKGWQDDWITLTHMGLCLGVSASWWIDKHNEHHGHPNVADMDPDIEFPVLAFTEEQAQSKKGLARFIVAYQAFFFFFLVTLMPLNMRVNSIQKIRSGESKYPRTETLFMIVHVIFYLGLLFTTMAPWQVPIFALFHHALVGLYLAMVFAVNHKGMPVLESDTELDFLRMQVITSRNVKGHPVTDFLYGGLNYQIEHHLFPTMSQNKLREAQGIVRAFCEERGISYHETSFLRGQVEVISHLHEVSTPLRKEFAR